MYENDFSNYFVLATILVYVLGFTFDSWHLYFERNYSSLTVILQAFALGLYSLFYENGFLNANPYYQVFVVALITSYQTVVRFKYNRSQFYFYADYFGVAWAVVALVLYKKFPNVLNYILRYQIGFSILSFIHTFIPRNTKYSFDINLAVAAGISLGFVFISYLTFDTIANYCSTFLFSFMVTKGLLILISYTLFGNHVFFYNILAFKSINIIIFVTALGYQYWNRTLKAILLEDY